MCLPRSSALGQKSLENFCGNRNPSSSRREFQSCRRLNSCKSITLAFRTANWYTRSKHTLSAYRVASSCVEFIDRNQAPVLRKCLIEGPSDGVPLKNCVFTPGLLKVVPAQGTGCVGGVDMEHGEEANSASKALHCNMWDATANK